ncbi:MAG: hypothetical protein ACLQFR_12915, partial [Streptosporangiaceae bacterium]
MTEQPLDLRRSMQIVRRHWIAVFAIAVVGGLAGAAYTLHSPPLESSTAVVEVSATSSGTETQGIIAGTDENVLAAAARRIAQGMSAVRLGKLIKVSVLAPGVLSITAQGKTATAAERTANAIADSYVAYLGSSTSAPSPGPAGSAANAAARIVSPATIATGPSLITSLATSAGIGTVVAAVVGAVGAMAFGRRDRRFRRRDEIADAIGVPVLASIKVDHPNNVAHWRGLLENYRPSAAEAWRLRSTLQHLGLTEVAAGSPGTGRGRSLTVISISSDKRALAIGPQLAVYASSLSLPTMLVIGPQQDAGATAKLRTACAAMAPSSQRRGGLEVVVADNGQLALLPEAMLTVVVAVVDGRAPQFKSTIRTDLAVLAVSAGAPTADELAHVAASAGAAGLEIDGILVADPDESDPTTGRVPHIGRNVRQMR